MSGTTIKNVYARQVVSDRGLPSIEATIITENGAMGRALCTAGTSVGTHEVEFAYDGGPKWHGLGVSKASARVNEILAPKLIGLDAADQQKIDGVMLEIGKDKLGGNATAAVSAATLKAGAASLGIPLYRHIGGARAVTIPVPGTLFCFVQRLYNQGKQTNKPTYSFMAHGFDSYAEASYALWELSVRWEMLARKKWGIMSAYVMGMMAMPVGKIESDEELWKMATDIIHDCGYEGRVGLQVDVASDTYYDHKTGIYEGLFLPSRRDRDEQIGFILDMIKKYPFVIVEDPLYEDDFEGTAILTKKADIQIVGDDLFTTNAERVIEGAKVGAANCVLLKVNQIGTISEALDMIQCAYDHGYSVMPCMSRGEGAEICDYAVGINSGTIREAGMSMFANRFNEIEQELGSRAKFAGSKGIKGRRFHPDGI